MEEDLESHKTETNDQFDFTFRKSDELQTYIKKVETTFSDFKTAYTNDMEVKLTDLIPGLSESDILPDTEGVQFVVNADPKVTAEAGKARMFNLE